MSIRNHNSISLSFQINYKMKAQVKIQNGIHQTERMTSKYKISFFKNIHDQQTN